MLWPSTLDMSWFSTDGTVQYSSGRPSTAEHIGKPIGHSCGTHLINPPVSIYVMYSPDIPLLVSFSFFMWFHQHIWCFNSHISHHHVAIAGRKTSTRGIQPQPFPSLPRYPHPHLHRPASVEHRLQSLWASRTCLGEIPPWFGRPSAGCCWWSPAKGVDFTRNGNWHGWCRMG